MRGRQWNAERKGEPPTTTDHMYCGRQQEIPTESEVAYLGVTLQEGIVIDFHLTETTKRAKRLFYARARIGGQVWGYKAVNYTEHLRHVVHGWERKIRRRYQIQLLTAKRQGLIGTMKSYATTSTD